MRMPRIFMPPEPESPPRRLRMLRSEPMSFVQMIVQYDAARATVEELGNLGSIMFTDMNAGMNAFQRNFVSDLKRCDEVDRHLRYIAEQIRLAGVPVGRREVRWRASLDELQHQLQDHEADLRQLHSSSQQLVASYNQLVELSHVLQKCDDIFSEAKASYTASHEEVLQPSSSADDLAAMALEGQQELEAFAPLPPVDAARSRSTQELHPRLGYITGVIERSQLVKFERILFRATRGNLYTRSAEIAQQVRDPRTDALVHKNVFIVFFSGQRSYEKVAKICDAYGASRYTYPAQYARRTALLAELQTRIDELQQVLDHTDAHRGARLRAMAAELAGWQAHTRRQRAVHRALNSWSYDIGRKCLIAEGWVPNSLVDATHEALRRATAKAGAPVPSIMNVIDADETPPTYFATNKFTATFQAIVDGYGVPRYGELNPAVFTIITFPFLFGVMFGDVGHGLLILVFALYFVRNEPYFEAMRDMDEMLAYAWHGRYCSPPIPRRPRPFPSLPPPAADRVAPPARSPGTCCC